MDFQKVIVEFYDPLKNRAGVDDFGGTVKVEYEDSVTKFTGNYLIIENNNGVSRVYPLDTIKSFKSVNK